MTQTESFDTIIHLADNYINRQVPFGALSDEVKAKYHIALHCIKTGQYTQEIKQEAKKEGKTKDELRKN